MADAIGIVSGIATLFSFADTYFPGAGDGPSSTIRITAGLEGWKGPDGDKDPLEDPQGAIAQIKIFNANHELIGYSNSGGDVSSGQHLDISVSQANEQQGYYAQIFGADNAVCVPHITVTWASEEKYAWFGDFGEPCSLLWYYGGRAVDGTDHEPLCTWIGTNQDDSTVPDTIEINFPRFYAANQDKVDEDPKNYCNDGLRGWKDGNDIANPRERRRRATTSPYGPDQRLVVSSFEGHNATRLCTSETSHGPDFVSLSEQMFCDMENKELMPLCGDGITEDCFHVEGTKKVKRDAGDEKAYVKVLEWSP